MLSLVSGFGRSSATRYTRRRLPLGTSLRRTVVTTYFTKDHESISYDDQTRIGSVRITQHAQESLGDVVFVEMTPKDTKVSKGDPIGAVESVKAASDIYAPLSGKIVEVNSKLSDKPGNVSSKNEQENWICKIELEDPPQFESLLTEQDYKKFCETESES